MAVSGPVIILYFGTFRHGRFDFGTDHFHCYWLDWKNNRIHFSVRVILFTSLWLCYGNVFDLFSLLIVVTAH